jgi:hypothetical protein
MNADERLNNLKNTFTSIINKRNYLFNILTQQQTKIQLLKTNYAEYIKSNTSSVLIFGLDSFHFQSKLLDIEYEDLNKFFLIINNRIYCDYFKLYKLIIDFLLKNIKEPKLLDMTKMINSFPVYKDLEPYKEYDIQAVNDIHEQIILLLTGFNIFITHKETILKTYVQKKNIGFNLDNFVSTYNYEIVIITQKLILFFDYIDFFHKIHSKYLNTFSAKLTLMINELNRDIKPMNEKSDIEIEEIKMEDDDLLEESTKENIISGEKNEILEKSVELVEESPVEVVEVLEETPKLDESVEVVEEVAKVDESPVEVVEEAAKVDESPVEVVEEAAKVDEPPVEVVEEAAKVDESPVEVVEEVTKVDEPPVEVVEEAAKVDEPPVEVVEEAAKVDEPPVEVVEEAAKVDEPPVEVVEIIEEPILI